MLTSACLCSQAPVCVAARGGLGDFLPFFSLPVVQIGIPSSGVLRDALVVPIIPLNTVSVAGAACRPSPLDPAALFPVLAAVLVDPLNLVSRAALRRRRFSFGGGVGVLRFACFSVSIVFRSQLCSVSIVCLQRGGEVGNGGRERKWWALSIVVIVPKTCRLCRVEGGEKSKTRISRWRYPRWGIDMDNTDVSRPSGGYVANKGTRSLPRTLVERKHEGTPPSRPSTSPISMYCFAIALN